jgi:hypothetical protein
MMPFNRTSQPRAAWTAPGLGSHPALPLSDVLNNLNLAIEADNDVSARQGAGYRVTVQVAIWRIAGGVIYFTPPAVGPIMIRIRIFTR